MKKLIFIHEDKKNRIIRKFIETRIPNKNKIRILTSKEMLKLRPGDRVGVCEDFNTQTGRSTGYTQRKVKGWRKFRSGNHLLVLNNGIKYRLDGIQAGKRHGKTVSILIK